MWTTSNLRYGRTETVFSWFPHLCRQLVISTAKRARRGPQTECQLLAWLMTDCCATGALITIKRALSHALFLLECLSFPAQRDTCTGRHTHWAEALISGRKEYNEWVIKTQGRIAVNLWPLSEHGSYDKGRISGRLRRQVLRVQHHSTQARSGPCRRLRAPPSAFYLIRGQTPMLIVLMDNSYIVRHLFV